MAERNVSVNLVAIWRWVQRYAPILESTGSPRNAPSESVLACGRTYVRLAGSWTYLYRAIDSAGEASEFMLSPNRDLIAARLFLRLALSGEGPRPRVINVDGHPAYPGAVAELKQNSELGRRCRCRTSPYLENIVEQDHRFIKKRISVSLGFRSVGGACRTIEDYEATHAIRKGQVRWVAKSDPVAQRQFIHTIFGHRRLTSTSHHAGIISLCYLQQNHPENGIHDLLPEYHAAINSCLRDRFGSRPALIPSRRIL